jgi:FlaA1/EpsC-like NDP-sugar epimerase
VRTALRASFDCLAWAVSLTAAVLLRGDVGPRTVGAALAMLIAAAVLTQLCVGWALLYRYRWRICSFEEICALAVTAFVAAAVVLIVDVFVSSTSVLPSTVIGGSAVAFVLMAGARGAWRLGQELRLALPGDVPRALIFGAGDAGRQLIDLLVTTADRPCWPVALLDDDPAKQHFKLRHLEVLGTRAEIGRAAASNRATTLIIAIPSADAELVRAVTVLAEAASLEVQVLSHVTNLLNGVVSVADIHPVNEEDLLGRRTIDTEIETIASYLRGRRVLVTGAGGSIGSELCRQIHRYAPSSLIMLDRDESGIHQVQLSIEGRASLDTRNLAVCDIRDTEGLEAVFAEHRPDVVFHAAALKHLPLLEMWPAEAYKTNVLGTLNVLHAARRHGVTTFVNISTDKAANPKSVLGYSKRIAERLTAEFAESPGTDSYMSVRFGNVLGSRGSVVPTFKAQIAAGGPITVTDPDVTRYFMTIEESVQLVIQAGAIGRGGDVLILDMGKPVRIDDVARRLARESPRPIKVVYTGLRPGEKLHEELFSDAEECVPTEHALISRSRVPAIAIADAVVPTTPIDAKEMKFLLELLSARSTAKLDALTGT